MKVAPTLDASRASLWSSSVLVVCAPIATGAFPETSSTTISATRTRSSKVQGGEITRRTCGEKGRIAAGQPGVDEKPPRVRGAPVH